MVAMVEPRRADTVGDFNQAVVSQVKVPGYAVKYQKEYQVRGTCVALEKNENRINKHNN